jgi:Uma2 family endonuclease
MEEYQVNGAQLGWLIDPLEQVVTIYRPEVAPVRLEHPTTLTGDPELPGFTLELGPIWEPDL